jgi:hypothetical protein
MTKLMIVGSILLTFAIIGAAEQPRIEGKLDQRAEAPTYGPGDSWVFKVDRSVPKGGSSNIDEIQKGGEFVVAPGEGKLEVFRLVDGKQVPVSRPGQLPLMLATPGLLQREDKFYDFPLFVGKKWESKIKGVVNPSKNEVTGLETVTTPAGTFQAYKIERIIAKEVMKSGDAKRWWFTSYYSPQTRSLVKLNYEYNTIACGVFETVDVELVKYGKTAAPKPNEKENYVAVPTAPAASPSPAMTIKLDGEDKLAALQSAKVKEPLVTAGGKTSEAVIVNKPPVNVVAIPTVTPAAPEINADNPNWPAAVKDDMTSKKNVPGGNLTLKMNIIGQRKEADGSYSELLIRDGTMLRSRDNFRVHLETNRPAYVYILLYDSQGKASQLFPDPRINHSGLTDAGAKLAVPDANMWFWLDEDLGTETIFVLASEKPMTDIRALLAKIEKTNEAGQQRTSQEIVRKMVNLQQRGIGGVKQGPPATYQLSDGKKIEKITEVVTGAGAVVRMVSFRHETSSLQQVQARGRAPVALQTRTGACGAG